MAAYMRLNKNKLVDFRVSHDFIDKTQSNLYNKCVLVGNIEEKYYFMYLTLL